MKNIDDIRCNIFKCRYMILSSIYLNDQESFDYWEGVLDKEIKELTKEIDQMEGLSRD